MKKQTTAGEDWRKLVFGVYALYGKQYLSHGMIPEKPPETKPFPAAFCFA